MLSGASAAPGQGSAGGVAAGLEMLWSDLANCPALGAQGVLASVRVKDGRLVGTQGRARVLRKQHGTRVPYKVRCGTIQRRGGGMRCACQQTGHMSSTKTAQAACSGTTGPE
jgi:hypothetical protein